MLDRMRINSDEIKFITTVESITGAKVRDCVACDGVSAVIIEKGDMGLAIGKGGANVERARKALGTSVWFIEAADDAKTFIKNMFAPVKLKQVSVKGENDSRKAVVAVSKYDKGKVIGAEGKKINFARKLARRHHQIKDIKIITK